MRKVQKLKAIMGLSVIHPATIIRWYTVRITCNTHATVHLFLFPMLNPIWSQLVITRLDLLQH